MEAEEGSIFAVMDFASFAETPAWGMIRGAITGAAIVVGWRLMDWWKSRALKARARGEAPTDSSPS